MPLTDTQLRNFIKAAEPIAGISDGGGLYFTLSKKGTAAWIFRYRYGGKQKEYTVGRYPDIALADARKIATALRNKVNEGIKLTAPTVANDLLRFFKCVFDRAVVFKKIPFSPVTGLTIKDAGGPEKSRERYLELDEIATLFTAMQHTPTLGRENELALKLLLLLGVRKSELVEAKWSEFNLKAGVWHLPAERAKTSKSIRIPLPGLAIEWLEELRVFAHKSEYVFPARLPQERGLPHISPDTLNVALKRVQHNLPHFVIHDLRRTLRTHLGRTMISEKVIELCLNHKLQGIRGIYDCNDYFGARKEALDIWATEIGKIENGNVVSIFKTKKSRKV